MTKSLVVVSLALAALIVPATSSWAASHASAAPGAKVCVTVNVNGKVVSKCV